MSIIVKSGASGDLWTVDPTSKAGRVTLYDAAGNALKSITLGANYYQGAAIVQNVEVSTGNSSTANLGSGATFTGASETSLGIGAIQVNHIADQDCTVQVQQSEDNANWDLVDSYRTRAAQGDSRTIQATASYFRVLVTNNGSGSTTYLRLQTVMAPTIEALPRALSQLGNLRMCLSETTITKWTYVSVINGLTPPATPTDMVIIYGSPTRTIRVTRVAISCTQTTAGINTFHLVKRSAVNTGGTAAAAPLVPHDSTNPAATAVVYYYTANAAALGATPGNIRSTKICTPAPASLFQPDFVWDFDTLSKQRIVLRGAAEGLALNFAGAALPTGLNVNCSISWTEEL